uniref:YqaJ viral recombinase domain-containing protein n=1 Tax=Knipowitschia caucasica TaxID=637954 RepID=A0AAV2JV29_KNICA
MLSSLAVSPQQKEAIERATVGQTKNALWMAYRRKRITASNFGLVLAAVKRNSYPPSLFKTLLGHYNLKQGAHACDWGIVHEQKAKEEYMKRTGVTFQESGVFLSDSGLLGGSPDGLVSDDCIIEVTGEGCDSIGGHTNQSLKCVEMVVGIEVWCGCWGMVGLYYCKVVVVSRWKRGGGCGDGGGVEGMGCVLGGDKGEGSGVEGGFEGGEFVEV